jgi:hypothetical protein
MPALRTRVLLKGVRTRRLHRFRRPMTMTLAPIDSEAARISVAGSPAAAMGVATTPRLPSIRSDSRSSARLEGKRDRLEPSLRRARGQGTAQAAASSRARARRSQAAGTTRRRSSKLLRREERVHEIREHGHCKHEPDQVLGAHTSLVSPRRRRYRVNAGMRPRRGLRSRRTLQPPRRKAHLAPRCHSASRGSCRIP